MLNIGLGLLRQIGDVARHAGREILKIYDTDFAVETKEDSSPVTRADKNAEALIIRALAQGVNNGIPVIGEEQASERGLPRNTGPAFWLIDPLDGTKEFINRNGEFTVNIAIVENGRPVLGVVHLPAKDVTYLGANLGSFRRMGDGEFEPITVRDAPADGLTALVSRSHASPETEDFIAGYKIAERISAGSSLKFCRVAEGAADLYPRMGRTMEWDTAAGHAVLRFAGGQVLKTDGTDLSYGKPGLENPDFIAVGKGVSVG